MSTALQPASDLVIAVHAHGLDEAAEQLGPLVDVNFVQLERGPACFDGAVVKVANTVVGRCHGSRNKLERFDVPRDRTLAVTSRQGLARVGPTTLDPSRVVLVRGPAELVMFTGSECHSLFALLPSPDLPSFATPVARIHVLQLCEAQSFAFAESIEATLSGASDAASVLPAMCAAWLGREHAPAHSPSIVAARRNAAVRAREFIDRNLDRRLSLASVCHASYSSPRALEYGFREVFGVSPITYVRCSRLSSVRRELYSARPVHGIVTQLAMKWGFWHLSQFAKDYNDLFGELPSTTLSRANDGSRRRYFLARDRMHVMQPEPAAPRAQIR